MRHKVVRIVMTLLVTVAAAFAPGTQGQTGSQPRLISTVTKQIGAESSTYVFRLYSVAALSNYHYLIEVSSEGEQKALQSVEFRNGVNLEDQPGSFQIVDMNSDGYHDIKVLGGHEPGKAWYKVWLYDQDTHKYVWSKDSAQ